MFPYPVMSHYDKIKHVGQFSIIDSSDWLKFFLGSAVGFLLLAGAGALFVYAWGQPNSVGCFWIIIVGMGVAGLFLVWFSLFTRRVIMVDREKGTFIDSKRALFTRREATYRLTEMAFVGLESFDERYWQDGKLKSESRMTNVWLEMVDGQTYSFGQGESVESRSFAQELSGLMKLPLREYDPKSCPSQDRWTHTPPDD